MLRRTMRSKDRYSCRADNKTAADTIFVAISFVGPPLQESDGAASTYSDEAGPKTRKNRLCNKRHGRKTSQDRRTSHTTHVEKTLLRTLCVRNSTVRRLKSWSRWVVGHVYMIDEDHLPHIITQVCQ